MPLHTNTSIRIEGQPDLAIDTRSAGMKPLPKTDRTQREQFLAHTSAITDMDRNKILNWNIGN
jgi:hypothetical protein